MFRDAFILFLIENGIADHFVINNKNKYTDKPNMIGCISNEGKYTVYHTDELGQVSYVKEYDDQFKAYYSMGKEFGLNFGEWIKSQNEKKLGSRTM